MLFNAEYFLFSTPVKIFFHVLIRLIVFIQIHSDEIKIEEIAIKSSFYKSGRNEFPFEIKCINVVIAIKKKQLSYGINDRMKCASTYNLATVRAILNVVCSIIFELTYTHTKNIMLKWFLCHACLNTINASILYAVIKKIAI